MLENRNPVLLKYFRNPLARALHSNDIGLSVFATFEPRDYNDYDAYMRLKQAGFNPRYQNAFIASDLLKARRTASGDYNPALFDLYSKSFYDIKSNPLNPYQAFGYAHSIPTLHTTYVPKVGFIPKSLLGEWYYVKNHEDIHSLGYPSSNMNNLLIDAMKFKLKDSFFKSIDDPDFITLYNREWLPEVQKKYERDRKHWPLLVEPNIDNYAKTIGMDKESFLDEVNNRIFINELLRKTGLSKPSLNYFLGIDRDYNTTEVEARLSGQIKSYLGIADSSKQPLTGSTLKDAFKAYPHIDNNMTDLYNLIDKLDMWDVFALYANMSPKAIAPWLIGGAAASTTINNISNLEDAR